MSGLDHNVSVTTDGLGHIHVHELAQVNYLDNRYYVNMVSRVQLIFWKCCRKNISFRKLMLGE